MSMARALCPTGQPAQWPPWQMFCKTAENAGCQGPPARHSKLVGLDSVLDLQKFFLEAS